MVLLVASLAVVAFLIAFHLAGVAPAAGRALGTARTATAVMRDPALRDEDKEAAVRTAGISLLGSVVSILARSVAAVLASLAPILLADALGVADAGSMLAFLSRWDVILAVSAAMTGGWLIARRL